VGVVSADSFGSVSGAGDAGFSAAQPLNKSKTSPNTKRLIQKNFFIINCSPPKCFFFSEQHKCIEFNSNYFEKFPLPYY
jgi:hypothetical protein